MSNRWKKIIAWSVVVLLVFTGAALVIKRKKALSRAEPPRVLPAVVDLIKVVRRPVRLTLPAMGIVSSDTSARISTKVSGRVTKVLKKEGSPVKRGEILATIDNVDLKTKKRNLLLKGANLDYEIESKEAALASLEIALANAKATHARTKELLDVKGASIEEFQAEETRIASIEAQVKATENALEALKNSKQMVLEDIKNIDNLLTYTIIKSPVNGTCAEKNINEGDMVLPGKPLFKITQKKGLYLNIRLPSDLHADYIILKGKMIPLVSKAIASKNGLKEYRADLPPGLPVVEGEYMNVSIVTFTGKAGLIPINAILSKGGKNYVFTYDNGKAKEIPVTIQARGVEGAITSQDLSGKTLIYAMPDILLRVATGVPVKIANTME